MARLAEGASPDRSCWSMAPAQWADLGRSPVTQTKAALHDLEKPTGRRLFVEQVQSAHPPSVGSLPVPKAVRTVDVASAVAAGTDSKRKSQPAMRTRRVDSIHLPRAKATWPPHLR